MIGAAALSLTLAACGGQEAPGKPKPVVKLDPTQLAAKQEIVRGNGAEPQSLDPHKMSGTIEAQILRDLLEGLVNSAPDGSTVPAVAKNWDTKDNKTFIFHLRHDARWSNGDPVTAHDFVYSWRRLVNPATASPYAWYLPADKVKNADAIVHGKKSPDTLGVEALDDYTFKVELEQPVAYFVDTLVHNSVAPVHKASIEKYGEEWTRPGHFVGNGAYKLSKWVVNERIELVRNDKYWDNAHTRLNKVTYLPIPSANAELSRYLAGEIDMTYSVPAEQAKRIRTEFPGQLRTVPYIGTYYYEFNTRRAPFDNVDVRKALAYAINRDIIAYKVIGLGQKPAYTLTPEAVKNFTPPKTQWAQWSQEQREQKARELYAKAGYSKDHPLKLKLLYNTDDNHRKIAIAVAAMWKLALGVQVTLENQEWKSYLSTLDEGNFDVTRYAWIGDYNEPSTMLKVLLTGGGSNHARYANSEYDALLSQSTSEANPADRAKYYARAEELLARDMPIMPIYQYVTQHVVKPYVGGYPENPLDYQYSKDMWIIKH
ncbi:peptide ABC transporter substrate-binding protein [Microbulbifer sp. SAOS-129_SWC]|uniref:peptide ABC transporter substrate-binding protein n=1 Tax=Microbulbifer sp. SAOS-129_SWC TaxID=3145235 RepID=UPI003217C194